MDDSWFNYCLDYFYCFVNCGMCICIFIFFSFFNCIDENCVDCGPTHC